MVLPLSGERSYPAKAKISRSKMLNRVARSGHDAKKAMKLTSAGPTAASDTLFYCTASSVPTSFVEKPQLCICNTSAQCRRPVRRKGTNPIVHPAGVVRKFQHHGFRGGAGQYQRGERWLHCDAPSRGPIPSDWLVQGSVTKKDFIATGHATPPQSAPIFRLQDVVSQQDRLIATNPDRSRGQWFR